MLLTNVTQRLGDYIDVSVDVDGIARFCLGRFWQRASAEQQREFVATTIERPNNAPARVDWLITQANGPKIEDMISEGVSMRITQRNDYESFLNNNGGNVVLLIRGLQQKAAQLAAAN